MADSSFESGELHPALRQACPGYPTGISKMALLELIDRVEEGIVAYPSEQTPAIDGGIVALRGIRDHVDECASDESNGILRYWADSLQFQLRGNLHTINIGEKA